MLPIHIWPRSYISISDGGAFVCLSRPRVRRPKPFAIRRQNTTRAGRVDGVQSEQHIAHCLGCKFFACISVGAQAPLHGGYTSCSIPCPRSPPPPPPARSLCSRVSHEPRQMHVFARHYCPANSFSVFDSRRNNYGSSGEEKYIFEISFHDARAPSI